MAKCLGYKQGHLSRLALITSMVLALLVVIVPTSLAQPIEVEFWSPFPPGDGNAPTASLQVLVDRFNDQHPDIRVVHYGMALEELNARYMTAFASDTLPDIGWGPPKQFYSNLNVVPIGELAERDQLHTDGFWPGLWNGFNMIDGIQWGYPFEVGAQGLIYNKDRFESFGIGEPPVTWDDLINIGRQLTDPERNQWALQPIWAWQEQVPYVWRNHGDIVSADQTRITFTDPATVEAIQWLGDLENVHRLTGGGVPDGSAAMIVVHPGWYGMSQDFPFEVGYAQPPIPEGGQQATRAYYQELILFRSHTDQIEAAWTFLKWLMAPENIAYWNTETGYLPTSRDVLNTDLYATWLNENPGMMAWLETLNYLRGLPRLAGFENEIGNSFMHALNMVRSGQASAQVALESVQDSAQAVLDEFLSR